VVLVFPEVASASFSWSAAAMVDPHEAVGPNAFACPSASQCTAVDESGGEVTFNPASPGSPTRVTIDPGGGGLFGLACPSASQCVAVDFSGREVTFNPTTPATAMPVFISPGALLTAVACPSATQCTALDGRLEFTFDPTSPGVVRNPVAVDPSGILAGIVCPSVSQCTGVDQHGSETTFNPASPGTPTPVPIDLGVLDGVACPSVTQCTAVDQAGGGVTFNPASPGTFTRVAIDPGGVPNGIACSAASLCVAVDHSGQAVEGDPTGSAAWTVQPIANAINLTAVACPSSGECVAADGNGDELTGTNGPPPPPPPPSNIAPPSISGTAVQGQPLSEAHGAWSGSPTGYSYQWEDCDSAGNSCAAVAGATSQTYTLTSADVGHTIRVQETARNTSGVGSPATSAPTGVVAPITGPPATPSSSFPPAISGRTTVGQTLTSSTGTWSGTAPISYRYQWQRCDPACANLAGSTSSSFRLVGADLGAKIAVVVTASNSAGSAQAASRQVGPTIAAGPSSGQVKAALGGLLTPSGKAAKLRAIVKAGGYKFSFSAPSAGKLILRWVRRRSGRQVLVASARVVFHKTGQASVRLRLTAKGRKLLKGGKSVKIASDATFTPTGGSPTTRTKRVTLRP
jgi:hypothetical protein